MAIPTTSEIYSSFMSKLEGTLGQTVPILVKSFTGALAAAVAMVVHLIYIFAEALRKDSYASSASAETTVIGGVTINPLAEHGARYGLSRYPGTAASYGISAQAAPGTIIPIGTRMLSDTGFTYELRFDASGDQWGEAQLMVRAIAGGPNNDGVGVDGLDYGGTLSFELPPAGVSATGQINGIITVGSDAETEDAFRSRVVLAQSKPTNYGDQRWYREACKAHYPQATYYVYRGSTPNTVAIYTDLPGSYHSYLQSQVALKAPMWDTVSISSLTTAAITVEIRGLVLPAGILVDTVKAAIQSEVASVLDSLEPWCVGLSIGEHNDAITSWEILAIASQIARSNGGTVGSCYLKRGTVDISEVRLAINEVCTLNGSILWT